MATLPEVEPVKAVPVSSLDELHTGDHILYQDTDSRDGYRSALVTSEPEDGCLRVITIHNMMWGVREGTLQFSSLPRLHKVQYSPCQYSGEEAVWRAKSGGLRYSDSHKLVSWAKTGVEHSLSTIIEELKAKCGEPVKAVPVSSPDELHTGDHILYQDTDSRDDYRSVLVAREPKYGRLTFITKDSFMSPRREEALQFSSLPHLHKVQYTRCLYSGQEAVWRAWSRGLRYCVSHELVSWAKTGMKHSLSTIIEELKAQCGEPVEAVPVSSLDELHTGVHILYQDTDSRGGYRSALVASEPEDGRLTFITKKSFMSPPRELFLQFSSLPHLHKVQYTRCQYSGEEAVQRARSSQLLYNGGHELVSLAKTGVEHSLGTIIEELKVDDTRLHIRERDHLRKPDSGYISRNPSGLQDPIMPYFQRSDEELISYEIEALSPPDTTSSEQPQSDEGLSDEIEAISPPDTASSQSDEGLSDEIEALSPPDTTSSQQAQSDEGLSDEGEQQPGEALPDAVSVAPIRGCTIVAERNFPITQSADVFNWPEYGITISAPENSIPENIGNTQSILLNVRVSLSGPFQLGASKLMSAVYWLCPNIRCKFAKPLELTVEHCAHLTHPDDHTKLTFLRTKCNQKNLPYKFEEIEGQFTAHSGTVLLRSFSGIGVGSKSAESSPPPMKYLARIVMLHTLVTEWKALYAVLKDLKSFRAFDSEKIFASDPFTTTYTSLKFKEDTVRLNVPVDGVTVKDGNWRILPLVPPRLSIPDGESYEPFRDFPECSFVIEWVGSGYPSTTLHHIVALSGTADKDDFFALHVNPGKGLQQAPQQSSSLSTQGQESKHRAIEGLLPDLADVISSKSSPARFADHLVSHGFLSTQSKSDILETKGETPHNTVSKLLNAVVVTIKRASSPEESAKHFENFVTIIRKLELNDLALKLTNICAELDAAAALSAEASAPFTIAPAGIHQVNTAPQLNPLSPTGSPQKRQVASAPADTTAVVNSPVPQAKPTKPELKDALKKILPFHNDWQTIGALLGMEEEKLSAIQDKQKDVSKNCLRVMLDVWLKSTAPPPSWQALADAVESIDSDTADKIQREYIH